MRKESTPAKVQDC